MTKSQNQYQSDLLLERPSRFSWAIRKDHRENAHFKEVEKENKKG